MIGPAQILLVIVVVILTTLLTIIGVQVYFILKELRRSVEKFNKILNDTGIISESVAKPIHSLSDSITGFSGVGGILSWLFKMKNMKREKERVEK